MPVRLVALAQVHRFEVPRDADGRITGIEGAEAALAAEPGVTEVRSVKMRWIGHRLHADAELDIDPAVTLRDAHRIAHDAEHTLTHAVPKLTTALVHAYPATSAGPADQS